ncbi:MAG: hypothetical protein ACFCU1_08575 [Sumerlaeia bacterium]
MIRLFALNALLMTAFGCGSKTPVAWENTYPVYNGAAGFYFAENAPFPHESRADGYTRNGVTYPVVSHYLDNTVGVYIPSGFDEERPVTILYYFHGHNNNVRNALLEFKLTEMVFNSTKNCILVFPQGPLDVPDSAGGKLEEANGLRNLHDEITAKLIADGKLSSGTVDSVYLSGHSGAYKILHNCLAKGGLNDLVTDVYLLDASYGGLNDFTDWMMANPQKRFVSIYTAHLEDENNEMMQTLTSSKVSFRELDEDNAFGHILRDNPRTFIFANKSDHNGTVSMLQEFLETSNAASRGVSEN